MKTEPEAIVEVRFLTTKQGGRQGPVVGFGYRPTFEIDGEYYAGGFLCGDAPTAQPGPLLELGVSYEIPVMFVCPDLVLPKLFEGKSFTLWEGKTIATGKVICVLGNRSM